MKLKYFAGIFALTFCIVICQNTEEKRIKCIVSNTSIRSQWKAKTCPPYTSYCVTSYITAKEKVYVRRFCGGPTRKDLIQKSISNQTKVEINACIGNEDY